MPFLQQYLNSKAILRCSLVYFHWNRAPSREQSIHYIINLVSKTSRVNKNPYCDTFFAKHIHLRWLGYSQNWVSLARLLTQISGDARHARPASWVGFRRNVYARSNTSPLERSPRAFSHLDAQDLQSLGRKGAKRAHKVQERFVKVFHLGDECSRWTTVATQSYTCNSSKCQLLQSSNV